MFDPERFKADCRTAVAERAAVPAIREVAARAVEDPAESRRWSVSLVARRSGSFTDRAI